jgi:hypothetical protein
MTLDVAFPHQEAAFAERRLTVDNQSLPYGGSIRIKVRNPS